MEINRLIGLNEHLVESYSFVESGVVLDDMGAGIRTGTPCLIFSTESKRDYKGRKFPASKVALFPTPYHPGAPPRHLFDINPGSGGPIVKSRGPSDLLDTHKSLEVTELDLGKLDELINSVQTKGPISLIITENKNDKLKTSISTMCKEISKKFKFASVLSHHKQGTRSLVMGDRVVCALTFSDIKNSLPVFDPEKSAGISVNLAILYTEQSNKNSTIVTALDITMIFSAFKENFTTIKGQPTGINLTSISKISDMIKGDSTYSAVGNSKLKNKKEEKQEVREKNKAKKQKKSKKLSLDSIGLSDLAVPSPQGYVISASSGSSTSTSSTYGDYGSTYPNMDF